MAITLTPHKKNVNGFFVYFIIYKGTDSVKAFGKDNGFG